MPEQTQKSIGAREIILSAATDLMTGNGIRGTSLSDIATLSKVSKGTLYYYFPAKEDLILAVAEEHIAALTDNLYAWLDSLNKEQRPETEVLRLFSKLAENESDLRLYAALCGEAALGNKPLTKRLAEAYKQWQVLLDVGFLKLPVCERLRARPDIFLMLLNGFCIETLLGTAPKHTDITAYTTA